LASDEVGSAFQPGDHAATFGGGPLACAAALASVETIECEGLLRKSREDGKYFLDGLNQLWEEHGIVEDVRGVGMMLGMELSIPCAKIVNEMREKGVLVNCAADVVLRFVPPLVITRKEIDTVINVLDDILARISD
ncbi:MAG TPA: aminotransferase class III-fold pyridoxal phosphate-dependent enzyme, partial [Methanobacteriaceae archaeon]|nr:aminotransferase class III-fold pyridoxal phosphate-dependent enzyme [Methanobacteriaceae archaeon]